MENITIYSNSDAKRYSVLGDIKGNMILLSANIMDQSTENYILIPKNSDDTLINCYQTYSSTNMTAISQVITEYDPTHSNTGHYNFMHQTYSNAYHAITCQNEFIFHLGSRS